MTLKVGDTIWIFNENRRVYDKTKSAGPIYREHFEPRQIIGETSRSWLVQHGLKLDKKNLCGSYRGLRIKACASQSEIDDACYVHENRYRITSLVDRCRDGHILRQIDALLREAKP